MGDDRGTAEAAGGRSAPSAEHGWTFLTNHAHVLLVVARDPGVRIRDIADVVGITERRAHAILTDLDTAGYVQRAKVGRRNHYTVNPAGRFRHPVEADRCVGDLLALFAIDGHSDRSAKTGSQ